MPVISIAQIRDQVQTLMTPYLGTRTYVTATGTQTLPSLVLDYGKTQDVGGIQWQRQPKSLEGLEVVITPQQQATLTQFYSRQLGLEYTTTITLKQWDEAGTVAAAAAALISGMGYLFQAGVSVKTPRDSRLDTIESESFRIVHQIRS